jgi:DNA-binding protein H-NS
MAKTYADIQKEITALQKTAEALRHKEIAGVIDRIKVAISTYDLTASDLGLGAKAATAAPKRAKKAAPAKGKAPGVARFRDGAGNSWSGRGRRPAWYLAAIAAGKKPEDLQA